MRYLFLAVSILTITAQTVLCSTDAASPELQQALKVNSGEPNYMSIILALFFVVALIYITGVIYSKLNIVGAKTVQEQLKNYDLSRVIILSTTQLGQNKNLHVIEINKKRYLIGATPNSINLIKELGSSDEKDPKNSKEPTFEEAIDVLYGDEEESVKLNLDSVKEFDVHKKYL